MKSFSVSPKRSIFELSTVILTALGKFVFMDILKWRLAYVSIAIIAWLSYIIYTSSSNPEIFLYWGFRRDNFKSVSKRVIPFGVIAVVSCIIIGLSIGTINITWHILPILILYPIWGTIQQFLLIGLTTGNLYDLRIKKINKTIIVLLSAVLFAVVHYPYLWLMAGTFVLALFYGFIYLKERNLYVLGLFHGWLGAIFYYTILARDPFTEIFGKFI